MAGNWVLNGLARCVKRTLLLLVLTSTAQAGEIYVAVATNFQGTLRSLAQHFEATSKDRVRITSGSTGKLYAQIQHGAPFDVLLAADAEHPRLLVEQDLGTPGTRFTYAIGRLALWSARADRSVAGGKALKEGKFRHLAIANPKIAPYGNAARQVLQRLGLWESLQMHLVQGEDIGQAFQFVASGNADLGFVALSQVLNPANSPKGSYWIVPQTLYGPIEQQAVLLSRASHKRAAYDFLRYLKKAEARVIIEHQGYELPKTR